MKTINFENETQMSEYLEANGDNLEVAFIVEHENRTTYDLTTECKSPKTALRRAAKAFGLDWLNGYVDDNHFPDRICPDADDVAIEHLGDDRWYVFGRIFKQGEE